MSYFFVCFLPNVTRTTDSKHHATSSQLAPGDIHVVLAREEGVVIPGGPSAARIAKTKGYHGNRSALVVPDHFDRGRFERAVC